MTKATLPVLALFVSAAGVAASPPSKADVQRGAYLVSIVGCNHCHTPLKMGAKGPKPDMARMLTGHPAELKMTPAPDLGKGPWMMAGAATNTAFAGPWGVSYASNLTPDPETGIGKWTEKMFVEAMRSGRHLGKGRPILPPMPWESIAAATDQDLKAIFAYLRTLPPLKNAVPEPGEPPKATP
jgi:cytochrome c553